jgi:hypothetical protein
MKLNELKQKCKELGIQNYSTKKKQELIDLIHNFNNKQEDLCNYSKFTLEGNIIELNEQQQQIVKAKLNENMRIIACAGSGKTTTIICRLKYLIDNKINPNNILITTFNVDASKSIKNKILSLFGYMPNITIGTIDSISKKFYYQYKIENTNNFIGVCEYASKLLNYLKKPEGIEILNKYQYIFFDEFQDINNTQFEIIQQFYKNNSKLILIGDDAQNIYSFRGSNIEYILNLEKYMKDVVTYKLVYNYRSTPEIINFANDSIKNNKDQIPKDMISIKKNNNIKPIIKHYYNLNIQNQEIIKHIISLHYNQNVSFDEIAIISRNNYCLKILEEDFEKFNSENTRKINYVALITNQNQDIKPNMLENHVTLTTIHKSKGLEWKVVFLLGCEDKYFPSEVDKISIEEERRLFYVAITRPKSILYISFTSNNISRFIKELDSDNYNFVNFKDSFFNYSEYRNPKYFNSVAELVDMINEEELNELRIKKILPELEIITKKIHSDYKYNDEINKYFLHSDYGTFIDRMISRCIGEKNNKSQGIEDYIANVVIGAVILERVEYFLYDKYKNNFKINIDRINSKTDKGDYIKILTENKDCGYIIDMNYRDKHFIVSIVNKIINTAKQNKFKMADVIVLPKNYLPENFKESMLKSLLKYRDINNNSFSILEDIYNISLCGNIYDNRRRLLYKNVSNLFLNNSDILKSINEIYIESIYKNKLLCKYRVSDDKYDINGEIDLIDLTDNKIIDFKCSQSKEIKIEWVLQLLTYLALIKNNKKKIDFKYIEIYNPLQGIIYTMDISQWDKYDELLDFLSTIRNKKIKKKSFEDTSKHIYLMLDD